MNRTDYMRAVYDTDLDPESKAILVYLGFCKNWKNGTFAFPSYARIAKDTGLSETTVKRRMPMLRTNRYLSDTGQRVGRGVIVYDLADPTGISQTPVTNAPVSQGYPTGISETPQKYLRDTAAVSQRHTEQVREQVNEPVREQVQESTGPAGSVDREEEPQVREGSHSLNLEKAEAGEKYLETLLTKNNIFGESRSLARRRYWDEDYEPWQTNGVHRAGWIITHLIGKDRKAS